MLLTASLSAALPLSAASHVDVVKMRTENRVNPLGIGTSTTPFLSEVICQEKRGVEVPIPKGFTPSLLLADYF